MGPKRRHGLIRVTRARLNALTSKISSLSTCFLVVPSNIEQTRLCIGRHAQSFVPSQFTKVVLERTTFRVHLTLESEQIFPRIAFSGTNRFNIPSHQAQRAWLSLCQLVDLIERRTSCSDSIALILEREVRSSESNSVDVDNAPESLPPAPRIYRGSKHSNPPNWHHSHFASPPVPLTVFNPLITPGPSSNLKSEHRHAVCFPTCPFASFLRNS
jgi:hypothetical protein